MKFLVTDIEFHFDKDEGDSVCNQDLDTFFIAQESVRQEVRDSHLGVWEADDDNDLLDEITASSGWDIKNIYYEIQLK
ncbi:MAG: hypothetical protein CMB76_08975 [Euryarchaeota archaeon]|nr:hypothetical protein [Euryarchaeota archaeon]|tara:strand:+ start:49 stop:282 length:234 start_codon:yes stop_codon:yes gene_type:complete